MKKEQETGNLPVIVVAPGEGQKGEKPPTLLSLKITNEKNFSPVTSTGKSGCGRCG